jgi:hypothetical protein
VLTYERIVLGCLVAVAFIAVFVKLHMNRRRSVI